MTQKLLFEKKDITVHEQKFDGIQGTSYLVNQGDIGFSTWDKPTLEYASLKRQIAEYLEERDRDLMEDVENEDLGQEFNDNVNLWGMDEFN